MTTITITPTKSLWEWRQGQPHPQSCYITLDLETGEVSAVTDPEIDGTIPMAVYHSIIRQYPIPRLKAHAADKLIEHLRPLFQRVLDGREWIWDRGDKIGCLSADAMAAELEIMEAISKIPEDDHLCVRDAKDYLSNTLKLTPNDIMDYLLAGYTIKTLSTEIAADAESDGIDVLVGLEEALKEIADKIGEEVRNEER